MCGIFSSPKTPKVVQRDPQAEADAAANKAAQKANSETAARRRRQQESSLLATGAQGVAGPSGSSLLSSAYGKDRLGS
jgi:hypothetical protein